MTGFDDNMIYLHGQYTLDDYGRKGDTYSDRIVPIGTIQWIIYQTGKHRVLISRDGFKDMYVDLQEGETLLDFYKKSLIPLPELDTKKKRNRRRVAD